MKKPRLLALLLMLTGYLLAHEGHDMPGAMPPAPHGGEVKEAADAEGGHESEKNEDKHEGENEAGHAKHDQHEGEKAGAHGEGEIEIFFEVVYSNKILKIFPLTLSPKNPKIFSPLPISAFSDVNLKVEMPRQKRTEVLKFNVTETHFEASFDPKTVFRFFTLVSAKYEKEEKKAKIQVEID